MRCDCAKIARRLVCYKHKHNKPFAMLLPTDLLEMVPKRADGVVDDEVRSRLQIVRVLTLGGSGLV